jgi:hypothetical protein
VMWCRLEHGGGVKRLGMGCPRRCRARPELGEKSNAGCGLRLRNGKGKRVQMNSLRSPGHVE